MGSPRAYGGCQVCPKVFRSLRNCNAWEPHENLGKPRKRNFCTTLECYFAAAFLGPQACLKALPQKTPETLNVSEYLLGCFWMPFRVFLNDPRGFVSGILGGFLEDGGHW